MDLVRAKKQAIKASSGRFTKTLSTKAGKNVYRILPSWRGPSEQQFWHDFGQHWIKNLKGEVLAVYICAEKTFGKPCDVCDQINGMMPGAADDNEKGMLLEAKSKGRALLNVLERGGSPDPEILEVPISAVLEKIMEIIEAYDQDITDLNTGIDIIVQKSGRGKNTEYSVMAAPPGTSEPVPAAVLAKMHNLDEYVAQEVEEHKRKALAAIGSITGRYVPGTTSAPALTSGPRPTAPLPAEAPAYAPPPVAAPVAPVYAPPVAGPVVAAAPAPTPVAVLAAAPVTPVSAVMAPAVAAAVAATATLGNDDIEALLKDLA